MGNFSEYPSLIQVEEFQLVSILHLPNNSKSLGVLIIVGGPQTRVGSHRQFVLLSRFLADKGYPVLRFDYRGMGDSDGEFADFEQSEMDIAAAINHFFNIHGNLTGIVVWGLCDAASAALMYVTQDSRVKGMVLLNPWVRSKETEARTYLRHYYIKRLFEKSFWKKLVSGNLQFDVVIQSFGRILKDALERQQSNSHISMSPDQYIPFQKRMLDGAIKYKGYILFILSGNNDFVAEEFRDLTHSSKHWRKVLRRHNTTIVTIPEANHTFAQTDWRTKVEILTGNFLDELAEDKNDT